MKKIQLHPGLILLTFAVFFMVISIFNFQLKAVSQGFAPAYSLKNESLFYLNKPMHDADNNTFEILAGGYAQDKNYIYYDGRTVLGVDRGTFEVLGYGIGKDKAGVWVFNKPMGVNGDTFKALGNLYYQVDNNIYYFETLVEGADIETFVPMSHDYAARDENNVYYRGRIWEDKD